MASIFPKIVSLTLTRACNLRCKMCGQWNLDKHKKSRRKDAVLPVEAWKKVINEISCHKGTILSLRGGEPFLYPRIIDLLTFIKKKGIFVSIDTNGMFLEKYADDIARLAIDNLVISIDGPEKTHDDARGVKGSFQKIQAGLKALRAAEKKRNISIPKILCFVISPYSYHGLDKMPDVARQLKINRVTIVPYYYFDKQTGARYEKTMREKFKCSARSWRSFRSEASGIDIKVFIRSLRAFKKNLKDVVYAPFMGLTESEYEAWFSNCHDLAKRHICRNPQVLADIQPNGGVNFCVDLPDYVIGNIRHDTLEHIWKGPQAGKFRAYLKNRSLAVCRRCGAQYIPG